MAPSEDQEKFEALLSRAENMGSAPDEGMDDAETWAAFIDGTLSIDELNDSTLESLVRKFGSKALVDRLLRDKAIPAEQNEKDTLSDPSAHSAFKTAPEDAAQRLFTASQPSASHTEASYIRPITATSGQSAGRSHRAARPWWKQRPVWFAVAAVIIFSIGLFIVPWRPVPKTGSNQNPDQNLPVLAVQWPTHSNAGGMGGPPIPLRLWGLKPPSLPTQKPNFEKDSVAEAHDPQTSWRLATVIVRLEDGWGSGAFISKDGWILSNYHVVADAVQKSAATGDLTKVRIIVPELADDHIKPKNAISATVYRVDPTHDLSLLRLDTLPADVQVLPFFELAKDVQERESCFVIGSQKNGPAWWIRPGQISRIFEYPNELSQYAAGAATDSEDFDRDQEEVILTDMRIAPGDSGGPLLNSQGQLIGLTFATPANQTAGSVGWHIALPHLRAMTSSLPSKPEGIPLDPWTAGLPESQKVQPELSENYNDENVDLLRYTFVGSEKSLSPEAIAVFFSFAPKETETNKLNTLVPFGLWGMENRGSFRFTAFVIARSDNLTAVGYTNPDGIVDEIRIGASGGSKAELVWRRDSAGNWHADDKPSGVLLIDSVRLGIENVRKLSSLARDLIVNVQ